MHERESETERGHKLNKRQIGVSRDDGESEGEVDYDQRERKACDVRHPPSLCDNTHPLHPHVCKLTH